MNKLLSIVSFLILMRMITEIALLYINSRFVLKNSKEIPQPFKEKITPTNYLKSIIYTLSKNQFATVETFFDASVLSLFLFSGVLPIIFLYFMGIIGSSLWAQAFTLIAMVTIMGLPSLPLDYWEQFTLEEKFGFNKSTKKLWITDKLKGLFLSFIIGMPILWLLLKILNWLPNSWWFWGSIFMISVQLLMLILYPRLILPLFNKLSPLPDGSLKRRLMTLADRTGFQASTIEVIDGSKRSGHSNAFFTGFGKFRRIVLFDTLITELSEEEIEAVLAHEIGHYRLGHIPKMLMLSSLSLIGTFFIVFWLMKKDWFYTSFGFSPDSGFIPAILLFSMLSGLITFWIKPLLNKLSRKFEYEADFFAKKALNGGDQSVNALLKLHEKNLSNLTPHPIYSAVHYSHPTLLERINALNQ